VGPGDLKQLTQALPLETHPDLIVGRETSDDAGVVRLAGGLLLVQTVDFFTPIVDDPYTFGAIAAANALSDVYAMGGRPLTVMNIACFPVGKVSMETLSSILKGGYDKAKEAGALLVGGHTVEDSEIKYGLSVTGTAGPDEIMTNRDSRPGDSLVLTKPLGTGVITTALKGERADESSLREAVQWMLMLSDRASRCAVSAGVKACTDVTGFGLIGHAHEMAEASGVCLELRAGSIPLMSMAENYAGGGYCPGGLFRNRKFVTESVEMQGSVGQDLFTLLFDPQTSGGLLLSCPGEKLDRLKELFKEHGVAFWEIGRVLDGPAGKIIVTP
jgi:selenide,water dikinase